ncbi:hypothetical protein KAX97_13160 [candidate division WOR-3 bacterium]|nr:hypothetical protein [candidate division WOR-3 bacterium]
MRFPQIPTDNLYKFMALSGITIIIVSLLPFYHGHRIRVEAIRLSGETEKLDAQSNWLTSDIKELKEETDKLEREVDKLEREVNKKTQQTSSAETKVVLDEESSESEMTEKQEDEAAKFKDRLDIIKTKNLEFINAVRKHEILTIESATKVNELKYLSLALWIESIVACICIVAGSILAEKGFRLWHKRLQIPQDKILQIKSECKDA